MPLCACSGWVFQLFESFAGQWAAAAEVPIPRPPFPRDATQSSSSFQNFDEDEGIFVQTLWFCGSGNTNTVQKNTWGKQYIFDMCIIIFSIYPVAFIVPMHSKKLESLGACAARAGVYVCVHAHVCACVCVRACVCARARGGGHGRVRMSERERLRTCMRVFL